MEACLNCDAPEPDVFCGTCGQRHVPLDKLDVRHVWLEYAEKGLRDMKFAHTLGTLFFRPGQLTLDYVAGKRKSQANPLGMLTMLIAMNLLLLRQFDVVPVVLASLEGLPMTEEELALFTQILVAVAGPLITASTYVAPLVTFPVEVLIVWTLAERNAFKAAVFVLHTSIFAYIATLLIQLLPLLLPLHWRLLASSGLSWVTMPLVVLYVGLALRMVYPKLGVVRLFAILVAQQVLPTLVLTVVALLLFAVAGTLGFIYGVLTGLGWVSPAL